MTPVASHKSTNAGAIAGGVVGGLAVVLLSILAAFYYVRKSKRAQDEPSPSHLILDPNIVAMNQPDMYILPSPGPSRSEKSQVSSNSF